MRTGIRGVRNPTLTKLSMPPPPNICIIYAFTYLNYKEMQICSCTKDNSSLCVLWPDYLFRDVGANVKSVLWYIVLWGF